MASKPVLTYWKGRGKAETIRMILSLAGIEWEDGEYLSKPDQMKKLRDQGLLMFQQVPLLQWEGKNYVQTMAVFRHIARKYGLDGKTEQEKYEVDMLTEGAEDFRSPFGSLGFGDDEAVLKGIREKTLPRYMPIFEKVLSTSSSGFLVGDPATMADIKLFEVLTHLPERCPGAMDQYPKIKEFYEKIGNLPQIKKYMSGPQRFGPNDKTYCDTVKATLGW